MEKQLKLYLEKIKTHSIKDSYVIKNMKNLYDVIIKFTIDNNINVEKFSEKVYLYVNGIELKKTCTCGKNTKFLSYYRGYRRFCGYKCSANDSELINKKVKKYKNTLLEKYGVDNIWNIKEFREAREEFNKKFDYKPIVEKMKKTIFEKYGVDNISKLDFIKQKKIDVYFKKTGYNNPYSNPEVKNKIKNTLLENYGVDTPLKNKDLLNKLTKTVQEKYGVDNVMQSPIIKEIVKNSYLKKYGVDSYMKSDKRKNDVKLNIIEKIKNFNIEHIKLNINSTVLFYEDHNYILECKICQTCYKLNSSAYYKRRLKNLELCTNCNPFNLIGSLGEKDLKNYIERLTNLKTSKIRFSRKEIDIYLDEFKIGFEFNGIYWHVEDKRDKNYHQDKSQLVNSNGIRLVHIWEDDWFYKQDIVKSIINDIFNKNIIISANECEIRKIKQKEATLFLNNNHLEGSCLTSHKIGLYHNNILVSLMAFNKKSNKNDYELVRHCNLINVNIDGGDKKMLDFIINDLKINKMTTITNNDYQDGYVYTHLGFNFVKNIKPDYKWSIDYIRENKHNWKKNKLVKMGYDTNKTESEIMFELGHKKVWNSGFKLYELVF